MWWFFLPRLSPEIDRLCVCTVACVFLWCFMIYACIKWIFVYFFPSCGVLTLLARSRFCCPKTGIIIVKHKNASFTLTIHCSSSSQLGLKHTSHKHSIDKMWRCSDFAPHFYDALNLFCGSFTLEELGVDGVLCWARTAQLHNIGII